MTGLRPVGSPVQRWWAHRLRRTVRTRLTILYTVVVLLCGVALLAITYLLVDQSTKDATFVNGIAEPASKATFDKYGFSSTTPSHRVGNLPPLSPQLQSLISRTHANDLHRLLVESGIALALTTVVAVALGYVVAGRTLRPLRTITATAAAISSANLHERLAMGGPRDELRELGDTFDELLGRLEASFKSQRQFVANASHELRSPLTRLRLLAEIAATDRSATVESLQATYQRVIAASEQQERLIDGLLALAQSQRGIVERETTDLAPLTRDALSALHDDGGDLDVQVATRLEPAWVSGDHRLVACLVANLIDNAVRYNIGGGQLRVATGCDEGGPFLDVSNDGPAILPTELARLFQPFERLQAGRLHHKNGHGLGLSIVEAIADAHQARITASPRPEGGLRVEVRFPNLAPSRVGRGAPIGDLG